MVKYFIILDRLSIAWMGRMQPRQTGNDVPDDQRNRNADEKSNP